MALGLALVATPVLANFAPAAAHAGELRHDAAHDGAGQDQQAPAKALPVTIVICCPATCLPTPAMAERVLTVQPVAWQLRPARDPDGRSPALDPHPPRL